MRMTFVIAAWLMALLAGWCGAAPAEAQTPRLRIQQCFQRGATDQPLMQMCSGLPVTPPIFASCMSGGPCYGEPWGLVVQPALGAPYCGAAQTPSCPIARPCGSPFSIACPMIVPGYAIPPFPMAFACGALPYPVCTTAVPCGVYGGLACPPQPINPMIWQNVFQPVAPPMLGQSVYVGLPPSAPSANQDEGVSYVQPTLPDLARLAQCRAQAGDEQQFWLCVAGNALPPAYRLTAACLSAHADDPIAAYVCSTGNAGMAQAAERFAQVRQCVSSQGENPATLAPCLAMPYLGPREQLYVGCLTSNASPSSGINYASAAVCALGSNLTPEQQVALNCAMTTGGEPEAFAVCTGGTLMAQELDKCWNNGIATQNGCFGPNNAFRQWANELKSVASTTFGQNSVVSQVASAYVDNVLAPGPNHELVKLANATLNDLRYGPGKNNEIVKMGRTLDKGLKSIRRIRIKW